MPLAGIEPALLAELDFESSASTSSATGALTAVVGTARYIAAFARRSTETPTFLAKTTIVRRSDRDDRLAIEPVRAAQSGDGFALKAKV